MNELKLDLPKIDQSFTEERTNVLGGSLVKGIQEALLEQRNKAFKEFVDKIGYIPPTITIEERPMKIEQNEDGNLLFTQDLIIKIDEKRRGTQMEKYVMLKDETKNVLGQTLYRIRAEKDFNGIKKGEKGGYIQQYRNLSQYGDCWVYDDATVFEDAVILGNARVSRNAVISGDAIVRGHATVTDNAKVLYHAIVDDSYISGNCQIKGNARIRGNSQVKGFAIVRGEASISNSSVYECAKVFSEAVVNNSTISGNAMVGGDVLRVENANITGDAVVKEAKDYLVMQNNWSSGRFFTYTRSNNLFKAGCFLGSGKELIEKAYKDGEEKGNFYKNAVEYVNNVYNLHEELENVEKYKNW